jgi:hypothetical protein
MARGPEYAESLTQAERRVLDTLLAEQGARPAPVRRSWRPPVVAAAASLMILLAIAAIPLLRATVPSTGAASAAPSAGEVLSELAAAAAAVPVPAGPAEEWYRHRLDVRVEMAYGTSGACRVTAITTQLWEPADTNRWNLLAGRLVAERVLPPPAAAPLAGCTAPKPDPLSGPIERARGVPGVNWFEMVNELGRYGELKVGRKSYSLGWPAYTDPRWPALDLAGVVSAEQIDQRMLEGSVLERLDGSTSQSPIWWMALGSLLASPVSHPAQRAAALRAAAARNEAVPVPELTADVTGRPGVTLRVPYYHYWRDWTADLTFDVHTGSLLQQIVYADTLVDVTVYVAMRRV